MNAEWSNPIAAAAQNVLAAPTTMSPVELNNALVGPGGRPARPYTWKHRCNAALGWLVFRGFVVFALLTSLYVNDAVHLH